MEKISDNTNLEINITGLGMINHIGDNDVNITAVNNIIADESINITGLESIRHIFDTELPDISRFAVELLRLAGRAKEIDNVVEFVEAEKHRYEFNPVAAASEVRAFESRHNIRLPKAYTEFLTQVGNGGAGPGNGLYSLEELEFHNFYLNLERDIHYSFAKEEANYDMICYRNIDKPVLSGLYLTQEKFARIDIFKYVDRYDEYIETHKGHYDGALKILDSFDNCNIMLICGGDMCGEIVEMSDDDHIPHCIGKSFEEWLLDYFRAVIEKFSCK